MANRSLVRGNSGRITGNRIGVNVVGDDYDLTLLEEVQVFDNDTDVAREEIAMPKPSEVVIWGELGRDE